MVKKRFPADDKVLLEVLALVENELNRVDCPMKAIMGITVCVEEIFVNIAHYAYPFGEGDMTLEADIEDGVLSLTFVDSGIPFDPLAKEDPDITLPAEERDVGGLGILMVKKVMDTVNYERRDGKNILSMTKRIGA